MFLVVFESVGWLIPGTVRLGRQAKCLVGERGNAGRLKKFNLSVVVFIPCLEWFEIYDIAWADISFLLHKVLNSVHIWFPLAKYFQNIQTWHRMILKGTIFGVRPESKNQTRLKPGKWGKGEAGRVSLGGWGGESLLLRKGSTLTTSDSGFGASRG